ncbi:hypothetical protein HUK81_17590 [Komagataeibacter swingsii]|uniref:Uncharacterized protein n=2 Tax=Komagataeibacter TaxID=1434011 RepID=A0A850PCF4_9PROT|nr:helix-turn-helix domain-containing protein [Komagataeibacter oboediens]NVN38671.1 hypothetical protein [Komagataeibacter swingsii]QHC37623.1 hypothetical protein FMA36_18540 [Komagataeibacter xylinus]
MPEFMGDDGAMFPSHEAMAEKSGACRRTVINALNRAYALGIVKHTPRYVYDQALGKRVRTSNAYEIVLSALHQVAQAARFLMRSVRNHLSARPAHERPLSSHQPRDMKTGNSSFWVDTKWGARQPATIRVEGICLLPC